MVQGLVKVLGCFDTNGACMLQVFVDTRNFRVQMVCHTTLSVSELCSPAAQGDDRAITQYHGPSLK